MQDEGERAGGAGTTGGDARDAARLETLVQHRGCIDRIDKTIVALLSERLRLGVALGDLKRDLRLPARSEARESEVLTQVQQAVGGPLSAQSAERIFRAIIAETSAAQEACHE